MTDITNVIPSTYTSRKAAVVGAKRALEKAGIKAPLSDVHFTITQAGDNFTWQPVDMTPADPTTEKAQEPNGEASVGVIQTTAPATTTRGVRQKAAAKDAITEGDKGQPTPDTGPTLPIASDNPAKDKEMPALRRAAKPISLEAKAKVYPRREGSKQAVLVDLLSREQGATFGELYDGLAAAGGKPWGGSTIRSGLAWDMNHIAGYGIRCDMVNGAEFARQDREYEALRLGMERISDKQWKEGPAYDPDIKLGIYHLTFPRGVSAPVPHTPKKGG